MRDNRLKDIGFRSYEARTENQQSQYTQPGWLATQYGSHGLGPR